MSRHVVVISEDALVYEDLEILKRLPNFSRIWPRTARVDRIRSVYPTLTYPAHTTMRTGVYPDRHGIVNNEKALLCQTASPWEWFNDAVRTPDLFDACRAEGLSTAAVFWPVTGRHPSIDWLVDEYWPQSAGESAHDCFIHSGSSPELMEKAVDRHLDLLRHRVHPFCDAFIHACACSIIREFKPNLLMIHPANIDAYRHSTGLFSDLVTHGLHEIDLWLGDILKATQDAGTYEDTDFFIVSDHGQLNICRTLSPNVVLADRGLIRTDAAGKITDWTAFSKSAALSAQVYLRDPADLNAWKETHDLLCWMRDEGIYGISRVYTAEEAAREERLAGAFSFVIESDGYTSFTNEWQRPIVRSKDITDYRFGNATHGHHPDKGPQPTLLAFGPHIRAGAALQKGRLVDEAPTFARLLGVALKDPDGTAIGEILSL